MREEGELLKFREIAPTSLPHQYKVVLNEGKKRHIRRVIKALGYELLDLQRVKEGEYELGDLPEGEWREVSVRHCEARSNRSTKCKLNEVNPHFQQKIEKVFWYVEKFMYLCAH
jgi:16S rRNA U516 pseudouridylate synthase RsuA-like enzyme